MQNFKTKVLLVEDEELARKTLAFYLNTIFDEVVVACDGADALEIIKKSFDKKENFDLIITDLNMPNVNGMQMIDEILKLIPNQRFIIVSAHKNEEDLLKLINLRVSGYFVKPLNIDNMMEMLQKAKEEVLLDKQPKIQEKTNKLLKLNNSYTFDLETNKLYNKGIIVKLSKKESEVLEILIENLGVLISVDKFKELIWNDITINDSSFRTVMKRLKDKIKDDDFIISHKGYGYIIEKVLEK
ncbi:MULTISPECIES: response regulator transcription factor [Arcobacter]|jgi:DNA-binding response OmpR family regulator|uniref:Transcriptional regulator n=1 Tax=Arcobacter ellisii TaxID=913109 RepID=A0A347UBN6_9BACT|nr:MULTISPECIES: response regulator transcription factor [Arcobacter]AXX96264.1 two-component system response regulator [Arcobacter ellisii]MDY3204271.1 response regulator transcription factor [Arcobacter sp.]RXI31891.1 transcriptional regulator [Arcobacter ellisii]